MAASSFGVPQACDENSADGIKVQVEGPAELSALCCSASAAVSTTTAIRMPSR